MDKKREQVIALYLRAQKDAAKSGLVIVCQSLIAKRVGVSCAFVTRALAKHKEATNES